MKRVAVSLLLALASVASLHAEATIEIVVADAPDEGFNDPTPAVPIGGNPGTTVGQQRLNVFRFAASIWAKSLTSTQTIRVEAFFDPLDCAENSAVLGGAAPYLAFRDFGAGRPATWYPVALAEKLAGTDFGPFLPPELRFEVFAVFNSELGKPGCLEGLEWYYGLNEATLPGRLNFATTVLHELGHGLGFTVGPTSGNTGGRAQGLPSIWESRLLDLSIRKLWLDMVDAERAASARNIHNLVWSGPATLAAVPQVLDLKPELKVVIQGEPATLHDVEPASFGGPITRIGVSGFLMPAIDIGGISTLDACQPLDAQSAFSVRGRIALISAGGCSYTQKVINVQNAGAIAAVIAFNEPGGPPPVVGGTDPTITIPTVGISQALGALLRDKLRFRGRSASPVLVSIQRNPLIRSGTTEGYPRMYAPRTFVPGSSVSHWDVTLSPDQLMEPFDTPNIGLAVAPPRDLSLPLLHDIGW